MKKVIVLSFAIIGAVCANAATFQWKTATSNQVYLMNSTDRAATLTAYLFDTAVVSQQSILTSFIDSGSISSYSYLSSKETTSAGALTGSVAPVSYGSAGDTLEAFFAIIANVDGQDYIYISNTASDVGPATGNGALSYAAKASSQLAATEFAAGSATFGGAGWYTQSVPEPTSGLLLLLGMAGLALKRRQA